MIGLFIHFLEKIPMEVCNYSTRTRVKLSCRGSKDMARVTSDQTYSMHN